MFMLYFAILHGFSFFCLLWPSGILRRCSLPDGCHQTQAARRGGRHLQYHGGATGNDWWTLCCFAKTGNDYYINDQHNEHNDQQGIWHLENNQWTWCSMITASFCKWNVLIDVPYCCMVFLRNCGALHRRWSSLASTKMTPACPWLLKGPGLPWCPDPVAKSNRE